MSEKRHWLIRDKDGSNTYGTLCRSSPPAPAGDSWRTPDDTPWDGECSLEEGPDGTVYGHTLEPGGGPVDVSEWFPEGGRKCENCARSTRIDGPVCKTPYVLPDGRLCGKDHIYWKPPEPVVPGATQEDSIDGTILVIDPAYVGDGDLGLHAETTNRLSIGTGEEGGREMKTTVFQVVIVEEPNDIEARDLGKIGEIKFQDVVTARDRDGAIAKGMAALAAKKDVKFNADMLSVSAAPLRAE